MKRKIQEQNKTIEFIKQKYRQETGRDIELPKTWEQYLELEEDEAPAEQLPFQPIKELVRTFQARVDELQLPTRLSYSKQPWTSFSTLNTLHMVTHIDLSHCINNGVTKHVFRDFVGRLVDMRCLQSLNLSHNGLSDAYSEQIETLLSYKRINRLDLSSNCLGKVSLQLLAKNFTHIEWINIMRNEWLFETILIQGLLNTMRTNPRIFHIGIDLQDAKQVTTLCGYLKLKPQIHSLSLVDSKIDNEAMSYICSALDGSGKANRLVRLNLSFCYLNEEPFRALTHALSLNNNLVELDLSNNNLGAGLIGLLIKIVRSHIGLCFLNVKSNLLGSAFAIQLGQCLAHNQVLQVVDISHNNIGPEGGQCLLKSLTESNDTLESLGDFASNARMGDVLIQKLMKALRINRVSKQIRSELLRQQNELTPVQITSRQTQAFLDAEYQDYELLEPIGVTNPMHESGNQFYYWSLSDY